MTDNESTRRDSMRGGHATATLPLNKEFMTRESARPTSSGGEGSAIAPPVRLFAAEVIEDQVEVYEPAELVAASVVRRNWVVRAYGAVASAAEWLFGLVSLVFLLAALSTFPLLQFVSLGYLLDASGRIARSGRFRDGFVLVREAARLGSVALGTWFVLWPIRLVSDYWYSAQLIDERSETSRGWRAGLVLLVGLLITHLAWAVFRGGKLRHFLWPAPLAFVKRLLRGGMYVEARERLWKFVASLRAPYYFWLGLRGFIGAVAWLFVPVGLLVAAFHLPTGPAVLAGLIGFLLLPVVVLYLPFLQTQFARDGRLVAMFDLGRLRATFARAPLAHWMALVATLLFALPLYLLKIEFLEREVAWLPALVFVVFILPARWLTGWAVGRGGRRETPSWWPLRWGVRFGMVPVALTYVLFVYLTRYVSWYGSWSLFEQHAFLLPAPFLGL